MLKGRSSNNNIFDGISSITAMLTFGKLIAMLTFGKLIARLTFGKLIARLSGKSSMIVIIDGILGILGILTTILVGMSSIIGKLIGISSKVTIRLGILIGPKSIKLGISNNGSNIIIDGTLIPLIPTSPVDIPKSGMSICGNKIGGRVISGSNCSN
jgi:hypothetical protein